tara:strand:- start:1079 stop:1231 length:153 start_codon:yes stop_codon:yes gene_type:complete
MINWGIVAIGLLTTLVWYSIFTIGFFITITWLIVISAMVGIVLNLYEQRY